MNNLRAVHMILQLLRAFSKLNEYIYPVNTSSNTQMVTHAIHDINIINDKVRSHDPNVYICRPVGKLEKLRKFSITRAPCMVWKRLTIWFKLSI